MTPTPNRRRMPGITVYQRGTKWAYTIYGEPDILTGKRERFNKGGFASEEEAWAGALKKHAEMDGGRRVKPAARTVEQFFTEWLASVKYALKPSAYTNYSTNVAAYILPSIGGRRLQDITVPVLNAFYVHLLEAGRLKRDTNSTMYEYWKTHHHRHNGRGPTPMELSTACGTSYQSAKEAVTRYRRGRIPTDYHAGLSPKSVRNIHRLIHRAFSDAVAWDYVVFNPAEHASLPRERHRRRATPQPWSLEELSQWLRLAQTDRFAGMWVLAATTGMRRSELLGVRREGLDLTARTLTVDDTLISVAGRAEESDGKTQAGRRTVSLDAFTVAALRRHLEMLDDEQKAFGTAYPEDGWLFVWEDGRRPHPDTVTDRFNRLVDAAGARRIRLHDVRHTYSTLSLNSGVEPKILSDRVGHANPTVTFQIYSHHSTGHDRAAAELIGRMIADALSESAQETPRDP
ncbi:MAG: tyrosine-type recombinase/integrase [Pseudonocardiales bacterium]|nr:tyrosine-type recombinase/integrase [Pseudonocardiales bacterium]